MATSDVKAALDAQQAKGISKIDPISLPGFGPSNQGGIDMEKHRVRYVKIDFDEPADIAMLEILETRAIQNKGVYILSKEKFSWMEKMFILVGYLEKNVEAPTTPSGRLKEINAAEAAAAAESAK